jgi:hypothetical protein
MTGLRGGGGVRGGGGGARRGCRAGRRGGGGDRLILGSASTHRFRSSHLVRPPIAPHDENRVVIVPCGDG